MHIYIHTYPHICIYVPNYTNMHTKIYMYIFIHEETANKCKSYQQTYKMIFYMKIGTIFVA